MGLNLLKLLLYSFELISFITTIWVLGTIFHFIFVIRFYSGFKHTNQISAFIDFEFEKLTTIRSDIKITIKTIEILNSSQESSFHNATSGGYILINKNKININQSQSELIETINKKTDLDVCFIFKDLNSLIYAKFLLSKLQKFSSDLWNWLIFILISLFTIFMKISVTKINMTLIRYSKVNKNLPILFQNKYVYSYILFHLTLVLILPIIYIEFNDLKINSFFEFESNFFNSFYFDRTFLFEEKINELDVMTHFYKNDTQIEQKFLEKNKMFFIYSPLLFQDVNGSYSYAGNILLLSVIVWISNIFGQNIFEGNLASYEEMIKKTQKKLTLPEIPINKKNILKTVLCALIIFIWFLFLFYGFINFLDILLFYTRLILHNPYKILDWHIVSYLSLVSYHILFYTYLIYYSISSKIKLNNQLFSKDQIHSIGTVRDQNKNNLLTEDSTSEKDHVNQNFLNINNENSFNDQSFEKRLINS